MDWIKERALKIQEEQKKKAGNSGESAETPAADPAKAKKTSPAGKKTRSYPQPQSYVEASTPAQRMAMQLEPWVLGIREVLHGLDLDVKQAIKRNFVNNGKFRSHCLEFAGAGQTYQDRVFQFYVVCLADIEEWDEFFKFVDIAIHLKQTPEPSFIQKNFEEFRAWTFHDWAVAEQRAKRDPDRDGFVTYILKEPDRLPEDVFRVLLSVRFKSLVAAGKTEEALSFGEDAIEKGAAIKSAWQKLARKQKNK